MVLSFFLMQGVCLINKSPLATASAGVEPALANASGDTIAHHDLRWLMAWHTGTRPTGTEAWAARPRRTANTQAPIFLGRLLAQVLVKLFLSECGELAEPRIIHWRHVQLLGMLRWFHIGQGLSPAR